MVVLMRYWWVMMKIVTMASVDLKFMSNVSR
jgi:hypothetical protein